MSIDWDGIADSIHRAYDVHDTVTSSGYEF